MTGTIRKLCPSPCEERTTQGKSRHKQGISGKEKTEAAEYQECHIVLLPSFSVSSVALLHPSYPYLFLSVASSAAHSLPHLLLVSRRQRHAFSSIIRSRLCFAHENKESILICYHLHDMSLLVLFVHVHVQRLGRGIECCPFFAMFLLTPTTPKGIGRHNTFWLVGRVLTFRIWI